MKVTALLACHNRRDTTLRSLAAYFNQDVATNIALDAVLVDDGSSDGTGEAVRESFPSVEVVRGDGTLFWAGAMAIAEARALAHAPSYLFWLNDDVVLDPDALRKLLAVASAKPPRIAVGALRDPRDGRSLTYSGVRRTGRHPLRFELVSPTESPRQVETFNGNAVLVPKSVASLVGSLDGEFGHAAADYDYGLRASSVGVINCLAGSTVGVCPRNEGIIPWHDPRESLSSRVRFMLGPKGFPPRARALYLRRHGGRAWPMYWAYPYLRAAPRIIRPRRSK